MCEPFAHCCWFHKVGQKDEIERDAIKEIVLMKRKLIATSPSWSLSLRLNDLYDCVVLKRGEKGVYVWMSVGEWEKERESNSIYSISEVQAVSAIIKLAEWSHYNLDIHVSISNIRQSVISSDTLQYHAILFFPSALLHIILEISQQLMGQCSASLC